VKKKAVKKKRVREGKEWEPNVKQMRMVELLNNPEDKRSKEEKCKEVGVTFKTLWMWMKIPEFVAYRNSQLDKFTDGALPDIWAAHIRVAKRGDVSAIKLYYEMKRMLPETKVKQEITGKDGGPVVILSGEDKLKD
jgi:hypothetical protein